MNRCRNRGALWLAALVVAGWASPALADRPPTPEVLSHARQQVDQGDFEGALITLQDGLSSPDTSNDELVQLYWQLGEVYVYLDRDGDARDTFDRLLYVQDGFQPPRLTSPRVRQAFEQVRQAFVAAGRAVGMKLLPPKVLGPDRPIVIAAGLTGMQPDFTARVYYRPALTEAWQWARLAPAPPPAGRYLAMLPGLPAGSTLEYYVEIQSSDRRRVQGEGSSLSPRTLALPRLAPGPLEPPPPALARPPWYDHAWIWGVVAGAVIGGSVLAYLALQPSPATMHLTVAVGN